MKTLILVTTKGCEACNIMKRLVNKAFTHDIVQARSIEFETIDVEDFLNYTNNLLDEKLKGQINDFPTLLFIKDNKIVYKIEGTISVPNIIQYLCTYL